MMQHSLICSDVLGIWFWAGFNICAKLAVNVNYSFCVSFCEQTANKLMVTVGVVLTRPRCFMVDNYPVENLTSARYFCPFVGGC